MKDLPPKPTEPAFTDGKIRPLTRQEQLDQLAAQMLESAQRLATDPTHLEKTKKLLF